MNHLKLPSLGILMLAASATAATKPKTTNPVKVDPALINDKPYRFNGVVLTDSARGSGFCAWNKRTFFSAAHVVFGESEWLAPPTWTPSPNSETLDDSEAIQSRGYYRWTDYAKLVATTDSKQAEFSKDVILGYAFKNLITGEPANLNLYGSRDLRNKGQTLITGYPAENSYLAENTDGYFLHQTGPSTTTFQEFFGKALIATKISTGPGNSGGPVWTKSPKGQWQAAGVMVGGLPSESIVYAFSSDINALLRAVTPVIQREITAPVAVDHVSATSIFFPYTRARAIPDGVQKWTSFEIKVNGFDRAALVEGVKLSLDIQTKHRGDLQVALTGPGGYEAMVHNEEGAGRDNLVISNKDFTSDFSDIPANGKWYLRVQDRLTGDIATLKSILLEIAVKDVPIVTP
jgi:subtilisin-like proprotein convertase family protein/V8-like Glu-specific endopeptidase